MTSAITRVIINPRLDFFKKPAVNVTNTKYAITVNDPRVLPNGENPITFVINADGNFINFSESFLRFKLKITQDDGTNMEDAMNGHVNFIPNIFYSLFKMVKVRVNDYPVTPASDLYTYKAYIDSLFSKTSDSEHIDLFTGGDFDANVENTFNAGNPAWARRAALCNTSTVREYSGQLAVDFLRNSRNVLPGTKIEITLYPQPARFVIQHDGNAAVNAHNFKYVISDCQFFVKREEISPKALLGIELKLTHELAAYYFPIGAVKPYNLAAGLFDFKVDDIFNAHIPQKIICGCVRSTAFNGEYTSSPLFFNPTEEIESIEFFKNGVRVGLQRTMPIDIRANSNNKQIAYRQLNNAVNSSRNNLGLPFSLTEFTRGNFFAGIDLTPDGHDDMSHRYPTELGAISIYVNFRNALPHALELLIYGVFQEEVNINKSRQVISTLSV